ncbi:alpha/beta fold hydrolase [Halomonas ventosae]|uniref:alpha/beta fold hydrolase n=1 Tax=Halomonas ventosae TaxID=229007 RepID=UPI00105CE5FD|nr:alpha/beta hydrolase [Halomonas ventosae]
MAGFPTHHHAALQRAEIELPALVVGEEDRMLPPPLSRRIQQGVADASLTTIPGAGHLTPLEQPEVACDTAAGQDEKHWRPGRLAPGDTERPGQARLMVWHIDIGMGEGGGWIPIPLRGRPSAWGRGFVSSSPRRA